MSTDTKFQPEVQLVQPSRAHRSKKQKVRAVFLGLAGLLLIISGLTLVSRNLPPFLTGGPGKVAEASPLAANDLLPLAEPVRPIEGWHDMASMPDINQVGEPVLPDQTQPDLDLPISDYDFGSISSGPEDVSQVFYIQNMGTESLEIRSIVTSCGCTTASLSSSVIPAGRRADLTVVFNPDFHDTEGPVTRAIWLETNDPDQPVAEIKFTANVYKE